MEVHFSPDVETRLYQVASAHGKDADQLVQDTVARMLDNQARFIAGVQKGIEQTDRGELVDHKDVLARIGGAIEKPTTEHSRIVAPAG
jgi:predicted transcriptional regulator